MQLGSGDPLLTLIEPGSRSSIAVIKDNIAIKLRECSLVMVDVSKLPPTVTRGLSQQQLAALPPMGASPDAMLVGRDVNDAEILMPVECKAPCPFQHCNGAGEATWVNVPSTSSWSTVPAHYYAQCQMTMLLVWLIAFNNFAIKLATQALATCADPARQDLLKLSRVDARRGAHVRELGRLDSVNNQ